MAHVVVYSKSWCWYCRRAKLLLDGKGVEYEEIDVAGLPELEQEMVRKAGGRTTVPQIFINGVHVGGSDDLAALEARGRLDELLAATPGDG